jgi:hypothetical protein
MPLHMSSEEIRTRATSVRTLTLDAIPHRSRFLMLWPATMAIFRASQGRRPARTQDEGALGSFVKDEDAAGGVIWPS